MIQLDRNYLSIPMDTCREAVGLNRDLTVLNLIASCV